MIQAVFDASAVLALLHEENGSETVLDYLSYGGISSVNFSEIIAVLINLGMPFSEAKNTTKSILKHIIPFDEHHAYIAAEFRKITKPYGLSLGDRACLALAKTENLPVITADKVWKNLDLGIEVILIR